MMEISGSAPEAATEYAEEVKRVAHTIDASCFAFFAYGATLFPDAPRHAIRRDADPFGPTADMARPCPPTGRPRSRQSVREAAASRDAAQRSYRYRLWSYVRRVTAGTSCNRQRKDDNARHASSRHAVAAG